MIKVALERADAYFNERPNADDWFARTTTERVKALALAGRVMASSFVFNESAYVEREQGAPPQWRDEILDATCEEALWLTRRDPTQLPDLLTLGLVKGTVGPLSATFDRAFVTPLVCATARRLVGTLGEYVDLERDVEITSTPLAL